MTSANDPMAEIRASFFVECEELLEALQDGLQELEDQTHDAETIHVVFRAVHSIKGGAGAFGLEGLVRFAHRFETSLDDVRADKQEADVPALKLFFQCADHLSDLVRACRDDTPLPDARSAELLAALDELWETGPTDTADQEPEIDFEPTILSLDLELGPAPDAVGFEDLPDLPALDMTTDTDSIGAGFDIKFIPLAELFDTRNEPLILLRNLRELGTMTVNCSAPDLPPLDKIAPELPHLRWDIRLETTADIAEISSVFEFVEGLCVLEITPFSGSDGVAPTPVPDQMAPIETPQLDASKPVASPAPPDGSVTTAQSAAPEKPAAPSAATKSKSVVRVDLDRIERLVNLVGELVINQAMLSQSLEQSELSPHSDAMNGLEEFQRLTRDIQDSVMMIRAQPVKSLFQRMSRIVREASASVDKDVRLITEGETTEVDKTVIERLADPLTHMIRNAVDHGLESTADRQAAGKPAQGKVRLSAAHRSGRVIIEITDDGGGINREKVFSIAVEKGLVPADAQLSPSEIDNLLWLPGFSTATEVSDLSGRGVGMDVVRTEIVALGGRVTIASEAGVGTTFSISLPLTLAVLDGMVIEAAEETLVLPLNQVIETLTLENGAVQMLGPDRAVVRVRDKFVPLIDLGEVLGYRDALDQFEGAIVLLISDDEGSRAALLIDEILDQRQVVIKGLNDSFYRPPGVAAATILGDGQIALILDPSDIIALTLSPNSAVTAA